MILRCVFVLFFTVTAAFSQNNLIVFSSNAGLFNAKIEGLSAQKGKVKRIRLEELQ